MNKAPEYLHGKLYSEIGIVDNHKVMYSFVLSMFEIYEDFVVITTSLKVRSLFPIRNVSNITLVE